MANKIKRYSLKNVKPGMEIGQLVLTNDGQVVLGEGTILTPSLIERLDYWGISYLLIKQNSNEGSPWQESPESLTQKNFFADYSQTVDVIKQAFTNIRFLDDVPVNQMRELVDSFIEPLAGSVGVINHLQMVHRQDDYTFHHSMNVAVTSGLLGRWLGYTGSNLKELILAGLLHDVGKMQIPVEILNKPGKLSVDEMEIMKQHTTRGYQLVKKNKYVPLGVLSGILQHHERMDGTGYPLKTAGDKIHPFAKIIAVADTYDAMTSDRVYHRKMTPFTVVELLVQEMFGKLDPTVCTMFLNNVRDYFLGNIVQLCDGREAEVIYLGQFIGSRPVVRTIDGELLDLEQQKEYTIVKTVKA
jgi:putative nucleotidyltransferase with HDIG domain